MPCINDRIEANRRVISEKEAPPGLRQTRYTFDPDHIARTLKRRIVGQDDALHRLDSLFQVVRADLGSKDRPLGVCLLMGPTGVGKTETVHILSELIHGSRQALCRIDMNTLGQEHYASALTGAPPGYVGSKEGHTLFDADKIQGSYSKPGIVLFDELEKASPEVIRTLLNILDTGVLTLPAGNRTINFHNTLIFLTSNLGAAELLRYQNGFRRGWRKFLKPSQTSESRILDEALNRRFDPEFVNRIDLILQYQRLPERESAKLLDLELDKLHRRLRDHRVELEVTPAARDYLCRDYDTRYGARDLARLVRNELGPVVARATLSNPAAAGFVVDCVDLGLIARPQS
ncbi:AAA family ATPase [Marinobacter sp. 1_MG-2023]|uniref:AAA family ATPase n=1 Tax=Marinobacter sp. 1_MG-2023 TaxID=3062627 RepID=UPI0026E2B9D2|nr:AAA family ATPase [Marinobacter sp. 1_MG-2023]MDO6823035.1 AAA family ATPase [Marinobacter sp. 1_MG-2023]